MRDDPRVNGWMLIASEEFCHLSISLKTTARAILSADLDCLKIVPFWCINVDREMQDIEWHLNPPTHPHDIDSRLIDRFRAQEHGL